jgi:glycosyltransferase involved in cell wall biosynthesis
MIALNRWPWRHEPNEDLYTTRTYWPKISIVTPSFNQGQYIEETILSVLNQGYPNLEYIIIDGGSTDNTVPILKKYQDKITYWVSEIDRGQSHALNKGFSKATGEIFAYLNSDDCYYPKTLFEVANSFLEEKSKEDLLLIGNCYWATNFDDINGKLDIPSFPKDLKAALLKKMIAPQASMFWTMRHHNLKFYEQLRFCMDFEFWLQLIKNNYKIIRVDKLFSLFRQHQEAKTHTIENVMWAELIGVTNIYKSYLDEKGALDVSKVNLQIEINEFYKSFCRNNGSKIRLVDRIFSLKNSGLPWKQKLRYIIKDLWK